MKNPNHQIMRTQASQLVVKASENGSIEGYASTAGGDPDRHGEVVLAGAFASGIQLYKSSGELPVMLW